MSDFERFFQDPSIDPIPNSAHSNLYLLRRDIYTCFGIDVKTKTTLTHQIPAIWPGVMAILAGIDLIAKFKSGNDLTGNVGLRYIEFIEKYFNLDKDDSEVIYQLRNSLLHSFGLYSFKRTENKQTKEVTLEEWFFELGVNQNSQLLVKVSKDRYRVDINKLHFLFEKSVDEFKNDYESLESFKRFESFLKKYGWTYI